MAEWNGALGTKIRRIVALVGGEKVLDSRRSLNEVPQAILKSPTRPMFVLDRSQLCSVGIWFLVR